VRRLRIGAWLVVSPALLTVAPSVSAQAASRAEPRINLSEVVVTGTRLRRLEGQAGALSITPVAPEELNDVGSARSGHWFWSTTGGT
jgi:hypothetical protein